MNRGRRLPLLPLCTLVLALLLLPLLAPSMATARTVPAVRPPAGKVFRFRLAFEPATLDWNLGDVPIVVIQNSMRGLYRVDAAGKVVADLVEEATVKDKGRTWVFKLKPGVLWSDGVPLTAQHVTESFRRLLNPATASTYAYFLYDIEGARAFNRGGNVPGFQIEKDGLGVKVTSDLTFEVRLLQETPYFPAILTHWVTYPIRPDLIAKYRDLWTNPERLATLGPYRITELRPQTRIVMVVNPQAGKPGQVAKPWFPRVEAWTIVDDNTAQNLYDTGHLEFMTDTGVSAVAHRDLIHKPSPILYFVGVGAGHPLTSSRAGTLALSAALDRGELPKALNAPHRPTLDFCPPELWSVLGETPTDTHIDTIPLEGAPSLAKALLKDAGFASPADVPPLTLKYFNRPAVRELAEWLQAQWKKNLGIEVALDGTDPKSYWTALTRNPAPLFLNSKGAAYPDPDAYFRLFAEQNPQNLGRWLDADYEKAMDKARTGVPNDERRALYIQASRRLLVERPAVIPLFFRSTSFLVKPYVKGLEINPLTSVNFSAASY